MKKIFFVLILCAFTIISKAQLNDLRINFAPILIYNGKTITDIKDSADTYYSLKKSSYELSLSYSRIFKNDYFLKLRYGIEYFNHVQPEKRISSSSLWEINIDYKFLNHKIEIEYGKILSYKFINILCGGGLYYKFSPPSKQLYNHDEYSLSDHSFLSAQYDKYEYPSSHYIGIYLNTSIYFKLYNALSLGVELNNGFSFAFGKGVVKYTSDFYDSNHTLYKQEIQEDDANIKIFSSNLLDLKFGLRFVFPDIKKKVK